MREAPNGEVVQRVFNKIQNVNKNKAPIGALKSIEEQTIKTIKTMIRLCGRDDASLPVTSSKPYALRHDT